MKETTDDVREWLARAQIGEAIESLDSLVELLWYENQSVRQKFHNPAQTPATRLYN
jgi:hypothetical protein